MDEEDELDEPTELDDAVLEDDDLDLGLDDEEEEEDDDELNPKHLGSQGFGVEEDEGMI